MEHTQLSNHFQLSEFLNLGKYSDNIPTMQHVANMTYGSISPGLPSPSPAASSD